MKVIKVLHEASAGERSFSYSQPMLLDIEVEHTDIIDDKRASLLLHDLEDHLPSLIDYESGGLKKSPVSGDKDAFVALLVELVLSELLLMTGVSYVYSETKKISGQKTMSYRVTYSCDREDTGRHAAGIAVEIVQEFLRGNDPDLPGRLQKLLAISQPGQVENAA